MRAHALEIHVTQNLLEFGPFVFGEAAETGIGVTYGRTEFDGLETCVRELFEGAWEVLRDHLSNGIRLTADGQAERIGREFRGAGGQEAEGGCVRRDL